MKHAEIRKRIIPGRYLNEIGLTSTQAAYFYGWVDAIDSLVFDPRNDFLENVAGATMGKEIANRIHEKYPAKFEGLIDISVSTKAVKFIRLQIKSND